LTGAGACGASYQAIYEGEVRFEHCYKLDEQPAIPLTQRRECWREWTKFYTYGQTRDRIEYALARQRLLAQRIENPGATAAEAALEADAGAGAAGTLAAPMPTSAYEAPPATHQMRSPDAGTDAPEPAARPVPAPAPHEDVVDLLDPSNNPPGGECTLGCVKAWRACKSGCTADAKGCKSRCDLRYRTCVPKCL
jgi:hypothetical protein